MYYFIVFGKNGFPMRGFGTRREAEAFLAENDDADCVVDVKHP